MAATGPTFVVSWAAVMAAMMLPSELPLLRLDHATAQSSLRTAVLGLGYLAVWTSLAAPVWIADVLTGGRVLGMHGRGATAAVLGIAAAYQLTPLKRRCLAICRAPLARVLHGWRDGLAGAFRMGLVNGAWCVGCCAGFTLALLGLGMMNLVWMVVLGATIFVEKTTHVGVAAARAAAFALAAGAFAWAI